MTCWMSTTLKVTMAALALHYFTTLQSLAKQFQQIKHGTDVAWPGVCSRGAENDRQAEFISTFWTNVNMSMVRLGSRLVTHLLTVHCMRSDQSSCSQSHLWHWDSSDYCRYCWMEKCHQHHWQHCYYIWEHIFCRHVHSWQSGADHRRGNPNAVKSQELDYLIWWWHNKGSQINIHDSCYHSSPSAGILDRRKWSIGCVA